jgi:competence protein ComEC
MSSSASGAQVVFLDIGQGDSTLIRLPNGQHMLVDVYRCPGEGTVDLFKVLRDCLPPGESGRQLLDYLVITHAHDDHIWGLGDLAEEFDIGELWVPQYGTKKKLSENYDAFVKVVEDQPEDRKVWQKGSRTPVAELGGDGEVSVRCFSPPGYVEVEDTLDEEEARRVVHENCGVYRLTFSGVSVMLTGDSNLPAWERIVGYYDGATDGEGLGVLSSRVLHASHHGSRTFVVNNKGEEPWLEALHAIDPQDIVVSVGVDNKHDHPHQEMIDIYDSAAGSDHVRQTCLDGTLVMTVTGEDTYELQPDPSYAERFGWDEDGGSEASGGPTPGGGGSRERRPPVLPPPGFEKTPQRAPRRERYGR